MTPSLPTIEAALRVRSWARDRRADRGADVPPEEIVRFVASQYPYISTRDKLYLIQAAEKVTK